MSGSKNHCYCPLFWKYFTFFSTVASFNCSTYISTHCSFRKQIEEFWEFKTKKWWGRTASVLWKSLEKNQRIENKTSWMQIMSW